MAGVHRRDGSLRLSRLPPKQRHYVARTSGHMAVEVRR
jgi:hypothetical protein